MTYRPQAEHRQKIQDVIIPLTAAIYDVFGSRAQDSGRPIGAFYPRNVSEKAWEHLGGIWYRPRNEKKVMNRKVNPQVRAAFARSILTGESVTLPSGTVVFWEKIPESDATKLPPPLNASH